MHSTVPVYCPYGPLNKLHNVHEQYVKWDRLVIRVVLTLGLDAIKMNFRTNQDNLRQ